MAVRKRIADAPNGQISSLAGTEKFPLSGDYYALISQIATYVLANPSIAGTLALTGIISPSQITSNQNNYNPTSLSTAVVLRLTSDASRNITGLSGGASGRVIILENVGSFNIVLKDEDTNSTAGNRFALTADITMTPDTMVVLKYDSTTTRWRAVAGGGGGGSGDVVGPASSTDNAITRFDSTTGKLIQNSSATVDDNGTVNIPTGQTYNINGSAHTHAESVITFTDITTNDVSTTKHGYAPKAPNDTTKFLRGDASWASPTGGLTLDVNTTPVGNVGSGEDNLITYSVPGNTLDTNGQYVHFIMGGTFAASVNNKRIRIKFGSTTLFDTGALAITSAGDWNIEGYIIRTGSATQKCIVEFNSNETALTGGADYVDATEDLTTSLTLKATGEATDDNDVVQKFQIAEKGGGTAAGSSVVVKQVNTQTGASSLGTTTIPIDDTIPQNTEGTEFMTLAITPASATNILKIEVVAFGAPASAQWVIAALFQDSTANALASGFHYSSTGDGGVGIKFSYEMVAGTTSATTFKVRIGASSGNYRFNGNASSRLLGGVLASSITITEFTP